MIHRHNIESVGDEELLRAYTSEGDTASFGALYSRYIPLLYGLCLKYLKSPESAEDAVMQLFEELSEKVLNYNITNFRGWLYRVAQNHCMQIMRSRRMLFTADLQSQPVEQDDFLDLLEENGDQMRLQALHLCMEHLPDEQRICIREFFLGEKSYAEISEECGFGLKGVKSYIQNGKRNLKLCIEKRMRENGCSPI